ncbi:60S ribosomal protein L26 [Apodemus speciosus]|uniref:60S ribosomal protein L26 n=1 Tax=Apodemus speciosus TaxID=105296 RepID=A0ABQ0F9G4_APOSI
MMLDFDLPKYRNCSICCHGGPLWCWGLRHHKGQQVSKELLVCGNQYVIYIKWGQHTKAKGTTVSMDIQPSKVVITALEPDKDGKIGFERKAKSPKL